MIDNSLLQLQHFMQTNGYLISFSGKLTQSIIEELGEAVKKYLEAEERRQTDIFNIFSIFIEQTQNMKNYGLSKKDTDSYEAVAQSSIVTIGRTSTGNYVCSGNLIDRQDIPALTGILEGLAGLNSDELKRLYKEKRKLELPEGSLGAGLGLIEMARKTKRPLEFSFTPIDERFSFFSLKAEV
ncbi:SiaB family protein kinase [Paenibacillus cremeus]|uniref:Uncharacterized protein n=1 Tax=Paenibacillus cremeus TaxID=2163881 RepID=A0A559K6F5_9BACL|nr:SiaB family protein kinase [Paenibacillus cremeus]TVY07700.1 hypothetical protein FPZ49_22740 [Paenibacillus cremeus]